jgi:hypothetical protein
VGTRFRTLLAPVGVSTGDGRRFRQGGITLAAMPMAFEWVRERQGGHDGAVSIGAIEETFTGTVTEAVERGFIGQDQTSGMDPGMVGVWAIGQMYDDVDRETMPRLAEDVATAMHLIENGTLGPSVDLDTFEGVPVMAGTDDPLTEAIFELHMAATGQEPKIEYLVTQGRVRAATAVSIPAFAETSRPFELLPAYALVAGEGDRTINTHCVNCGDTRGGPVGHEISECTWDSRAATLALIASVGTQERELPAVTAFDGGSLTGPTPITYDFETGRVFGHIATWQTCHAGYTDVCVTAPRAQDGYAAFNRFPVETEDGIVWAGRITAGGRHAGLSLAADATMREYDSKSVVAYVRAYEDEFGIAVAGMLAPDLSEGDRAVLSRRKVSGDWRETSAGLSLLEVLALSPGPRAHSEPGFPVETFSRSGRQVALVASLGPEPGGYLEVREAASVDVAALAAAIVDEQQRRSAREAAALSLAEQVKMDASRARAGLAAALGE